MCPCGAVADEAGKFSGYRLVIVRADLDIIAKNIIDIAENIFDCLPCLSVHSAEETDEKTDEHINDIVCVEILIEEILDCTNTDKAKDRSNRSVNVGDCLFGFGLGYRTFLVGNRISVVDELLNKSGAGFFDRLVLNKVLIENLKSDFDYVFNGFRTGYVIDDVGNDSIHRRSIKEFTEKTVCTYEVNQSREEVLVNTDKGRDLLSAGCDVSVGKKVAVLVNVLAFVIDKCVISCRSEGIKDLIVAHLTGELEDHILRQLEVNVRVREHIVDGGKKSLL